MGWIEVSVSVPRAHVAVAERVLQELGALAVTLEDAADDPVLEPDPGSTPLWPGVRLRGLFADGLERGRLVEGLCAVPGLDRPGQLRWREVEDRDWTRAWMDRFRPMKFGERLWVVPGGMEAPFDPDAIRIDLDPGLAFGTGTHPTTALCLEWLDGFDVTAQRVVDYGCGSGILGIAAALKGAAAVFCVDNDPQALEATAANVARNSVGGRVFCQPADAFSARDAALVLANILAAPLIALAPVLSACTRAGGTIVLSGLLEEQGDEVAAAYRADCELRGSASREGWLRLELRKRPIDD
jgi:ribosomal protein L11 methyltransferase